MNSLHVYLNFPGNTEEAFLFYQSVFGGEFGSMFRFRDMPIEGVTLSEEESGKIMHIGMQIGGGTRLMANDVFEMFGKPLVPGNNFYLFVSTGSRAEADRIFNTLGEGGEAETPMADQAWGDYYGALTDRFGVQWMVSFEAQPTES